MKVPGRYAVGFTCTSKSACLKEGVNIKSTTILGGGVFGGLEGGGDTQLNGCAEA